MCGAGCSNLSKHPSTGAAATRTTNAGDSRNECKPQSSSLVIRKETYFSCYHSIGRVAFINPHQLKSTLSPADADDNVNLELGLDGSDIAHAAVGYSSSSLYETEVHNMHIGSSTDPLENGDSNPQHRPQDYCAGDEEEILPDLSPVDEIAEHGPGMVVVDAAGCSSANAMDETIKCW